MILVFNVHDRISSDGNHTNRILVIFVVIVMYECSKIYIY